MDLLVEPATLGDLDAVVDLERHSFPTPWPRATFATTLATPHARLVVGRLRPSASAIAFCLYWLVAGEVQIHAIAIHPDHRRAGLGAQLLARVLARETVAGATAATLEVRASNRPAIALYTRAGFAVIHTRRAYYSDNGEDALIMHAPLP